MQLCPGELPQPKKHAIQNWKRGRWVSCVVWGPGHERRKREVRLGSFFPCWSAPHCAQGLQIWGSSVPGPEDSDLLGSRCLGGSQGCTDGAGCCVGELGCMWAEVWTQVLAHVKHPSPRFKLVELDGQRGKEPRMNLDGWQYHVLRGKKRWKGVIREKRKQ